MLFSQLGQYWCCSSNTGIRVNNTHKVLITIGSKLTPACGKISITLTSEGKYALLSVADKEPGIPQKDKERIFDRFYRGDTSRSISGNGQGLALVRSIAEKHNGSVTVNSDGENGRCFVLQIPH